jgi:predicted nucleic acid-binding protein
MHIVDSCGWLEWFSNGPLADAYGDVLKHSEDLLVPVIVLYEVYKILKREIGEDKALLASSLMKSSRIICLDEALAFKGADIALEYRLAMADAMIYATTLSHGCTLYTSDADLKGLAQVHYIPLS